MENKSVVIKSLVKGKVGIVNQEFKIRRIWERKGAEKTIDFDILKELIYDPGIEYMFTQGILDIADLQVKIALGLEPEGVEEPVNIIVLSDAQRKRLLSTAPIGELKETLNSLSYEQKMALADYAIENEITFMDRCELIRQHVGVDIIKAVQLNRAEAEDK